MRGNYVSKVLGAEDESNTREIWMLRQLKAVRESYIREVLGGSSARREK